MPSRSRLARRCGSTAGAARRSGASVVRVDPAGFLKVSALGIEEQRVRTTIDFVDPPEAWSRLGHDYRVIVHVTIWSADDALTVPVGALFRKGDDWAVFAVKDGRAQHDGRQDRSPKQPDGGGARRVFRQGIASCCTRATELRTECPSRSEKTGERERSRQEPQMPALDEGSLRLPTRGQRGISRRKFLPPPFDATSGAMTGNIHIPPVAACSLSAARRKRRAAAGRRRSRVSPDQRGRQDRASSYLA